MPHICILCNKEIKTGKAVQHPKGLIHIMCWEREKARIAQREIELAEKLELVAVLEAREDFYKFCQYMDPGYFTEKKWHLKLIARYLNEVAYGRIKKLLVSLAPRAGKSYTVSMFHAWLVGKFPEDSCMRNSYAAELAEKFSYDIRSMIQKPKYLKVWPEVRLKADRTAVNDWATEAARDSSYFCAGVGGSILGKGCRKCLPAGEMVYTDGGILPIEEIYQRWQENNIRVLSYGHKDDIIRYNKILDARRIISNGIIEITTESGRVLRCTADHRVWNGKVYIEAGLLREGDSLYSPNVCVLPQGVQEVIVGSQKNAKDGSHANLLFKGLRAEGLFTEEKNKTLLRDLRKRTFETREKILLGRMQNGWFKKVLCREPSKAKTTDNEEAAGHRVQNVWSYIQTETGFNKILFKILRGFRALKRNRRGCKSELSRFWRKIENEQEACFGGKGKRQLAMRVMRFARKAINSSFGQRPKEQRGEQLSDFMQNASRNTSQISQDVIVGIKRVYGEIPVYDIQVERDTNFFASEFLVHNCATLDDPVKNIEAALSETTMNSVWNWYTSTHMSRLESGCAELHVATRWSKRDPIGRLIDGVEFEPVREHPISPVALEGEGWEIAGMPEGDWVTRGGDMVAIVIPALIDGKSFCDEVHTTEEFLALKKMTEEFIWEAEYMQNPIEVKGLLFPIDELNRFSMGELVGKKPDGVIGVVDTADEGTDFLSAPVGSKFGDKVYVIDVVFTQEPVEVTWGLVGRLVLDTECRWMQVESNSGGKGYALKLREVLAGKSRCDVSFKTELSNKETRIFMGSGYVKRNFYFRNDYKPGSDYDKFMRQLTSYVRLGKNTHDDAADSITKLAEIMETIGPVGVSKPAPVGYYTEDELRDKGYKPYEIKDIMRKMPKPWEIARR